MTGLNRRMFMAGAACAALAAVALAAPRDTSLVGSWRGEAMLGVAVTEGAEPLLLVQEDGSVGGTSGCNRITGRLKDDGPGLFAPMAGTRMACAPQVMDQERRFHDALARAVRAKRDDERRTLRLFDAAGVEVARFAAAGPG